jgi:hypothetical protein
LSDQRRSLALAGLAVGAVFSAAVFRRKRRGGEIEFELPMPSTAPPAAQPDSGPPPVIPMPPPAASEPEASPGEAAEPDPTPINAPAAPRRPSPVDPPTGELSAEEASILAVLAQSGRTDEARTAFAVATSLERETTDVAAVLRKLGTEGIVSGELYTAAGDKIWAVTERGVRRLGAQS